MFKVYMADFVCFFGQIFMLFLYENQENKFLINFSLMRLRHSKASSFTSGWVQYCLSQETGDRAVTRIQDHSFCSFSIPQLFYMYRGRKLCGQNYEWEY